jgi:hypothetical protein
MLELNKKDTLTGFSTGFHVKMYSSSKDVHDLPICKQLFDSGAQ